MCFKPSQFLIACLMKMSNLIKQPLDLPRVTYSLKRVYQSRSSVNTAGACSTEMGIETLSLGKTHIPLAMINKGSKHFYATDRRSYK